MVFVNRNVWKTVIIQAVYECSVLDKQLEVKKHEARKIDFIDGLKPPELVPIT